MVVDISVEFPGGKRAIAQVGDHRITTDQSVQSGGEASAPEPMDLFFASLSCCVGAYALDFCTTRELDTSGLAIRLRADRDGDTKRYRKIEIDVVVPAGFPDKYRSAIARAVDFCTVKKLILDPPEFEVAIV